jgi:hypothetical protein
VSALHLLSGSSGFAFLCTQPLSCLPTCLSPAPSLQAALDRVMSGRTSLVIAHRLSTIQAAHSINVVFRVSTMTDMSQQPSGETMLLIWRRGVCLVMGAMGPQYLTQNVEGFVFSMGSHCLKYNPLHSVSEASSILRCFNRCLSHTLCCPHTHAGYYPRAGHP